ncbi:choline/carnitine/betaine transport [Enteractinococcus coprophilus]|uniref:Choline/carnitine/betaine transport n=2 Tax=Enteractinococcus coprophilus TaxID=1027633 RepID=A0A543AMV8_9MICC|nr:choline/carnitine/betaine transport [Enteractinococcus coprophilus]
MKTEDSASVDNSGAKTTPIETRLPGRTALPVGVYPEDIHPGLLSGVGIDDKDRKFGIDKTIFAVTGTLIVGFVLWGILSPESVASVAGVSFAWAMNNMGWLLNLAMGVGIFVMLYVAFSKYGKIKLGKDHEKPEFSRFSWVAMMFGAGLGVGLFFYGPSEPLANFISPPPHTIAAQQEAINALQEGAAAESQINREAIHQGVSQASYHWGLHIWSMYALVGGALGYATFRRGRPTLISSIFQTLLGKKHTQGFVGKIIDIFAIVATLFGTATTLGLSAIQIGQGVTIVSGIGPIGNNVLIVIISILGAGFIISAVSGVTRGIRYLSNTNITLTLGLVLFAFFTGPTLYLLNLIPSGILHYLDNYLAMMSKSLSWGPETVEFQAWWTAFYWAWWIAWTPFVGMFIARISRGRTLREFALVTMGVPTLILILAFTVFGGSSIIHSINGVEGFDGDASPEAVLFNLFDTLPFNNIMPFILIGVLAIFFITAADSASVVMGMMTSRGNPAPKKGLVVFWGLCMLGIAIVMLLSGGEDALSGLQSLIYLIALPFSLVLILMVVAFLKDLTTDPARLRYEYAQKAMSDAVIRGIETHGDEFEIAVKHSPDGRGAGSDVDASDPKYTEWYKEEAQTGTMKLVTGHEIEPHGQDNTESQG